MNFNRVVNNVNKVFLITKLNVKLEFLNSNLLKLYSKLGLLTYNMSCGIDISNSSIDELILEIESVKKEISTIKDDIKNLGAKPQ